MQAQGFFWGSSRAILTTHFWFPPERSNISEISALYAADLFLTTLLVLSPRLSLGEEAFAATMPATRRPLSDLGLVLTGSLLLAVVVVFNVEHQISSGPVALSEYVLPSGYDQKLSRVEEQQDVLSAGGSPWPAVKALAEDSASTLAAMGALSPDEALADIAHRDTPKSQVRLNRLNPETQTCVRG